MKLKIRIINTSRTSQIVKRDSRLFDPKVQGLIGYIMSGKKESEVAQSGLTLCDPMDCSPPGSSIHGIF